MPRTKCMWVRNSKAKVKETVYQAGNPVRQNAGQQKEGEGGMELTDLSECGLP